ncbi:MAG: YoaP domain-containing protein, partial [Bacteroidales bacterium]|nr:YoaP domain-containing protein [Bacteroidales bacterium]
RMLLQECLADAAENKMNGVALVVRKGTWMAGRNLFIKEGFEVCDTAPPDFELLVKKIKTSVKSPSFNYNWKGKAEQYSKGLYIITSDQCPYTPKAILDIRETAVKEYGIPPRVVHLKSAAEAQEAPCPFGTFCIILNGKVVADHPISATRFRNIMNKEIPKT